jgi:hypothetical protein
METNVLVGIVTTILVQVFKKVHSVPLNAGQTARIRMVVGAFSVLGALGHAYLTGDMSGAESALAVVANAFVNYVTASALYLHLKH